MCNPVKFWAVTAVLTTLVACACAGSKIPASGSAPVGEDAGCSNVEGFVLGAPDKLIVTTADCGGELRGWLSKPNRPGENLANTDPSLVLDRLAAGSLRAGEFFSSGPYCRADGKALQWVAVYEWKNRKKIDAKRGGIRRAWVIDTSAKRFVPAPAAVLEKAVCQANDGE